MSISLLLQLFLIILLSPPNVTHAQTKCLEHDKTLLLAFKNQLVFNSSYSTKLVQWNNGTGDCCRWNGVECDTHGHVIALQLDNEGISGGFNDSSSLFSLKYLGKLDLAYNFLSGSLPDSVSNLEKLTYLGLSNCEFTGVIPFTLSNMTQLEEVNLSNNFFTGSISSNHFRGLSNIVVIDLSYNSLSGAIPASVFALPSMEELNLNNNQFSGQVMSESPVVNISNYIGLDLGWNQLESPIPDSLFNIQSLTSLFLSHNLFNDTFELEKILSLPNLEYLDLSSNNLSLVDATSSIIHSSSFNLSVKQSSLLSLDLSNNKIAGEVPSWIWDIGNGSLSHLNLSCNMLMGLQKPYHIPASLTLQVLDLHSNQLRGELPLPFQRAWYVDFSNNHFDKLIPHIEGLPNAYNLAFLSIANNSLSGPIPTFLCNCTDLQVLDLSLNNLTGSIPPCLFVKMKNLQALQLGRNNLSGRIPDNFPLGCKLRTLDLCHNNLIGEVPHSLKSCSSLAVMNVAKNIIEDGFPCMLPSSLQVLVLRSNRFHGEVRCHNSSWPNLQIIDIAYNYFSDYLNSFNFSSWRGMMLDNNTKLERKSLGVTTDMITRNYYRDDVTLIIKGAEVKLSKIWPEFTSIDFACNDFHGHIPKSIGDLNSLYLLNLSHNALTGPIPNSFGKLRQLGSLDLSVNAITGEIPKEIAELTFLQIMNVSHNKLVGRIPVGSQIQTFSADSFEGNAWLCGLPLSIECTATSSSASPPNMGHVELDREIEWGYVSGAAGYVVGLGSILWVLIFCRSFRYKYFEKVEDISEKIIDFSQRKKRRNRGSITRNRFTRR